MNKVKYDSQINMMLRGIANAKHLYINNTLKRLALAANKRMEKLETPKATPTSSIKA